MSRLEKATRSPSKSDAERLDRLFGAESGVFFVRLYERITARPGGPVWFRSRAEEIESTARVLRSWDPLLVPGLLQTEAYARHLFGLELRATAEVVQDQVEACMKKASPMRRSPSPRSVASPTEDTWEPPLRGRPRPMILAEVIRERDDADRRGREGRGVRRT
ncbi:Scr1 family TA system antitoxin-like transcriptional regulator [Streptosporangium sp. NPDC001559]|uniref:Scr1 family TA system antitoxin-like transcriptional regulator n=1 Tax=Streptosporangium sp. NPDC001559 TaxID=3366187 RepID=UPI0036EC4849